MPPAASSSERHSDRTVRRTDDEQAHAPHHHRFQSSPIVLAARDLRVRWALEEVGLPYDVRALRKAVMVGVVSGRSRCASGRCSRRRYPARRCASMRVMHIAVSLPSRIAPCSLEGNRRRPAIAQADEIDGVTGGRRRMFDARYRYVGAWPGSAQYEPIRTLAHPGWPPTSGGTEETSLAPASMRSNVPSLHFRRRLFRHRARNLRKVSTDPAQRNRNARYLSAKTGAYRSRDVTGGTSSSRWLAPVLTVKGTIAAGDRQLA